MTALEIIAAVVIGLLAGVLGGLAGVGGSMIMLPGLALVLGYATEAQTEQHLYMAAAMAVNMLVALPAARKHHGAGAVRWDLFRWLLPSMTVTMVAAVLVSNAIEGEWLRRKLAIFIAVYCLFNLVRLVKRLPEPADPKASVATWKLIVTGCVTGIISGLLGLGGGVVMVPMLQMVCGVGLVGAIATTLTVMPLTALVGAAIKIGTLHTHGFGVGEAFVLILAMGPAAMIGGYLGATLTHTLPINAVRALISALLFVIALKLAGVF